MAEDDDASSSVKGRPLSLGQVCWFSVASEGVPYADLVAWAAELSLDTALLPRRPDPLEAFQKATTETRCSYDLPEQMSAQVDCRPLSKDDDRVVRALVRQITHPGRRALFHDQVGQAIYWRPPKVGGKRTPAGERVQVALEYDQLADYERPHLELLAEQLRDRYQHYRTHVDGDNLRDLVRRLLTGLRALRLSPSGAVYFVAAGRFGELRQVGALADRAQITLRVVTVQDTAGHRSMLAEVLQEQAVYQTQLLAANLDTLVRRREGKLTKAAAAAFQGRAAGLLAMLSEHAELLEVQLDDQVADVLEQVLDRTSARAFS